MSTTIIALYAVDGPEQCCWLLPRWLLVKTMLQSREPECRAKPGKAAAGGLLQLLVSSFTQILFIETQNNPRTMQETPSGRFTFQYWISFTEMQNKVWKGCSLFACRSPRIKFQKAAAVGFLQSLIRPSLSAVKMLMLVCHANVMRVSELHTEQGNRMPGTSILVCWLAQLLDKEKTTSCTVSFSHANLLNSAWMWAGQP
eukprot:1153194-Pelagomonas_calceolata.AAC.5